MLEVGDGSFAGADSTAGSPAQNTLARAVRIDEWQLTASCATAASCVLAQTGFTAALPASGSSALTIAGAAADLGGVTKPFTGMATTTSDGAYTVVAGYGQTAGSAISTAQRSVGVFDGLGSVVTIALTGFSTTLDVRCAFFHPPVQGFYVSTAAQRSRPRRWP